MAVIKNKRILKYLLMMVVSLFLILNFSIGVSASINYDRQEADACITISQRLSVKGGSGPIPLSKKAILKKNQLPIKGKIRFVPDKKWTPSQPLKKQNGGYIDRFGNVWTKGPSRTAGEAFEWDVQLSKKGIEQVGWLSRDNAHINVSLEGEITHR